VDIASFELYRDLFTDLIYEFSKPAFSPARTKAKAYMIFAALADENSKSTSKFSLIGKAISYLEQDPYQTKGIKELAEMCNLGECMFRRCFKQEMGISPVKYRNRLRIEKAYELLTVEARSVAEAMELTGFYDASYFNKTFKAYMGKSPSECKKGSRSI